MRVSKEELVFEMQVQRDIQDAVTANRITPEEGKKLQQAVHQTVFKQIEPPEAETEVLNEIMEKVYGEISNEIQTSSFETGGTNPQ